MKNTFQRRNALMGVLTSGVVIVEGASRSGQDVTVDAAEKIGAPVFAVPGSVTSASSVHPHRRIRGDRATRITCAAHIRDAFGSN